MGIRGHITRTNIAEANEARDWRIYINFAKILINEVHRLYRQEDIWLNLEETVLAFDSTTIDLCLSFFLWAKFRQRKGEG